MRRRRIGVQCLDNLQRVAIPHKPDPAASELRDSRGLEIILKLSCCPTIQNRIFDLKTRVSNNHF